MAKKRQCAGCSRTTDDEWRPDCTATVKPFTVNLTAAQRKRIVSLANVRAVPPEAVLRQALDLLCARPKYMRLTPDDLDAANRIRAGGKFKMK